MRVYLTSIVQRLEMRTCVLAVAFLSAGVSAVGLILSLAGSVVATGSQDNHEGLVLVAPASVDLGTVPEGTYEFSAKLENQSAREFRITKISQSCGCSSVSCSSSVVAPGGEVELTGTWNVIGKSGESTARIQLYLSSSGSSESEIRSLYLNAFVKELWTLEPELLVFQQYDDEQIRELSITQCDSVPRIKIIKATSSHPALDVKLMDSTKLLVAFDPSVWTKSGPVVIKVGTNSVDIPEKFVSVHVRNFKKGQELP